MENRNDAQFERSSEAWYRAFARDSYNFQCRWIAKARTGSIADHEWPVCSEELWQLSQKYQQTEFTDSMLASIYTEIERLNAEQNSLLIASYTPSLPRM